MTYETAREIETKLTSQDIDLIDACVEMAKDLAGSEQSRSEAIEAKANNLLGFAGIIAALTIDLIGLLQLVYTKNLYASIVLGILSIIMYGAIGN